MSRILAVVILCAAAVALPLEAQFRGGAMRGPVSTGGFRGAPMRPAAPPAFGMRGSAAQAVSPRHFGAPSPGSHAFGTPVVRPGVTRWMVPRNRRSNFSAVFNPPFFGSGFNNAFFFNSPFFFRGHFGNRFPHRHHKFFPFPFFGGSPFFGDFGGFGAYGAIPYAYYVSYPELSAPQYVSQPAAAGQERVVYVYVPEDEMQPVPERQPAPTPSQKPAAKPAQPERQLPPTVLIFRDQHRMEVKNYAIAGQTFYSLDPDQSQRITISDLDIPATIQANEQRGVQFAVPKAR